MEFTVEDDKLKIWRERVGGLARRWPIGSGAPVANRFGRGVWPTAFARVVVQPSAVDGRKGFDTLCVTVWPR